MTDSMKTPQARQSRPLPTYARLLSTKSVPSPSLPLRNEKMMFWFSSPMFISLHPTSFGQCKSEIFLHLLTFDSHRHADAHTGIIITQSNHASNYYSTEGSGLKY